MRASALLVALSTAATVSAKALRYRAAVEQPAAAILEKRAEPTAAWVTVDDEAQPVTTYTPSATVVDGTTSYENGAPHDLTATVYTLTEWGKVTTSTGEPPNPTASKKSGEGAFSRCHNLDGEHAPFCAPSANSTLYVGETYYVTWDPDYFNQSKSSNVSEYDVSVRIDYFNQTSWSLKKEVHLDKTNATWGYYPLYIDKKYLHKYSHHNYTLTLYQSPKGSTQKTNVTSIWVEFAKEKFPDNESTTVPKGRTLTIALPTVLGGIALLLIGGCLWNRKTRAIALGNVMGRNRGYNGRKSRRLFRKNNGIQLDTNVGPDSEYRDMPQRPRRDSDALGSLANSPVDPSFSQHNSGRNVFRDELDRQERERR